MEKTCKDFLLELNVEDLPSGYVRPALQALQHYFLKEFRAMRIDHGKINSIGTKNILVCYIKDVSFHQREMHTELIGPSKNVAFDKDGSLTKQGHSFIKAQGIDLSDLKIKITPKGEYVAFEKKVNARSTKDVLLEVIPRIIKGIYFPKTMRWDSSNFYFARPVESILVLFGKDILNIKIGNVYQKKINPISPAKYLALMQKRCILDPDRRKQEIKRLILEGFKKLKADQDVDENLLEEVIFMVSSPRIFVGTFGKRFLNLPEEVLKASMSKYQRIFPVLKNSHLINKFIAVIDGSGRDIRGMRKNYEGILEARLKDSLFFFEEDSKKDFLQNLYQLKDLIFQKDLGNMFEKIERLKKICSFICERLKVEDSLKIEVRRSAELSKMDLSTHMVGEFPSLQGIMGSVYALERGEKENVATFIREHYLPHGADDRLPETMGGAILAISDRIDNIVGFLGIGIGTSGSFDPFGIRRNSQGLIQIIKDKSLRFRMDELVQAAIELYGDKLKVQSGQLKKKILDYIRERIGFLIGDVSPLELKDAVLQVECFDIVDIFKRITDLSSISSQRYFLEAAKVVERTSNILKGAKREKIGEVNENLFKEDLERKLWDTYLNTRETIGQFIKRERYKEATEKYGSAFFKILHNFFDNVLVNVEENPLRLNRLAVMKAINTLYTERIADLSKLPQIVVN